MEKRTGITSLTIHDLPPSERTRERLQMVGVEVLSAWEILALNWGGALPDADSFGKEEITSRSTYVARSYEKLYQCQSEPEFQILETL